MSLAEIDGTIVRFAGAVDVMTANLLDLESNPTNKMLDPDTLTGTSRQRVSAARQALASLWEQFTEFKDLLGRARQLRGGGVRVPPARLQELEDLLHGPSISLPPLDVALADRGLYTPGQTPVALTPDQLLTGMAAAFEAAKGTILAVDDVWRSLVPRLGEAQHELEAMEAVAAPLGEPVNAGERTRDRLEEVSRQLANDPLSVKPDDLERIEASLSTERLRLNQLARDRETLAQDLDAGAATVDEIAAAIATGAAALNEAQRKLLHPEGLLAALDSGCLADPQHGLGPWLQRLRQLAADGEWRSACRGVDQWQRVADETLASARRVIDANSAPLQARNELRGRLDALEAKAGHLGLTEDPGLSALREEARSVLYTAPTDLAVAADLVARFGSGLSGERSGDRSGERARSPKP
jgi:hypothetical protein